MEWVFSTITDGSSVVFARAPAPWADGAPPEQAELLGYAPTTDINGSVLAALGGGGPAVDGARIAGLFLADPFMQVGDTARELAQLGIGGIANLPTVQLIDGEAGDALERTGHGRSAELDRLRALKAHGLEIFAAVCDREALEACLQLGPRAIIAHPGFAAASAGARRKSLASAKALLKQAAAPGVLRFLYHPQGIPEDEIAPIAALADGLVRLQPCSL